MNSILYANWLGLQVTIFCSKNNYSGGGFLSIDSMCIGKKKMKILLRKDYENLFKRWLYLATHENRMLAIKNKNQSFI